MFGKKKKEETEVPEPAPAKQEKDEKKGKKGNKKGDAKENASDNQNQSDLGKKTKRKFFSKKMFIIVLFLILSISTASFVVYKIYFSKKNNEKVYVKQDMPNIILAEEVVKFSYDFIPEFYNSMIIFNSSIIMLENEIKRLASLGEQFPDQVKITEKEMKSIEKEKDKLKQTYEKLEKRVESLYVSYKVNQEAGSQQIQEQRSDIVASSKDALTPVLDLTNRILSMSQADKNIPQGFVKGTIYKIKQKINGLMK